MTTQTLPPVVQMLQMLHGLHLTSCLSCLATLGVPDLVEHGPKSAEELAAQVGANPQALYRLMRLTASIGVHTAFQDSTPLVLFVGDVGSDCRDREAFQEVDYNSFFGLNTKGLAKRVERIDDPERIPEYVARAFATAMNGRPGPVVLVLPEDMLVLYKLTRQVEPA